MKNCRLQSSSVFGLAEFDSNAWLVSLRANKDTLDHRSLNVEMIQSNYCFQLLQVSGRQENKRAAW